jgi:hypothetical protein
MNQGNTRITGKLNGRVSPILSCIHEAVILAGFP